MSEPRSPSPQETREPSSLRVAIAGATGFVGEALATELSQRHAVVALGRRVPRTQPRQSEDARGIVWRRCDLGSLLQCEEALEGVDVAVYLVHSMQPNERLMQGSFGDFDLMLADNFGRAAASAGVRHIIYLGGLVPPDDDELSSHLQSRVEVEHALGSSGVPVTPVRAGLVIGGGGSSFQILVRLVRRLPLMICPRWTLSRTQPIAIEDVVHLLTWCVEHRETAGRVAEIGGPDVLSYLELMKATARALGRQRLLIPVPLFSVGLSKLWVTLFSGMPHALVSPLVDSLRHPMVVHDDWLQQAAGHPGQRLIPTLREAARREGLPSGSVVRSVQRMTVPDGCDAEWAANEYLRWLPTAFGPIPLLRTEREGDTVHIGLRFLRKPLLSLSYRAERSGADRALFEVIGGLLSAAPPDETIPARLEFRLTPKSGELLTLIHDFRPSLPWWIYRYTQAELHLLVMNRFAAHLRRRGSPRAAEATASRAAESL